MNKKIVCYLVGFLIFLLPQIGFANGIYIPETGARALGRGTAFAANPDNLSAFYFNPAGLANLDGMHAMIDVGFVVASDFSFERTYDADLDDPSNPIVTFPKATSASSPYFVPSLGFSYSPLDGALKDLTFAIGVYTPTAPKINFPEDGAQRYTILEAELFGLWTVAAVAWNITDYLRIGAHFGNAMSGFFELKAAASLPTPGGDGVNTENPETDIVSVISVYDVNNITFGLGASWDIIEHLTVGVSFYPPINTTMEGKLKAIFPDFLAAQVGTKESTDHIEIGANLPLMIRSGISYEFTDYLEGEFNLVYSDWSNFESFDIDLETGKLLGENPVGFFNDQALPIDAQSALTYSAGLEYSRNLWQTRVGFFYDESAIPDYTFNPFLFDGNKYAFTGGISRKIGITQFDLSYAHIFYEERNVQNGITKKLANYCVGDVCNEDSEPLHEGPADPLIAEGTSPVVNTGKYNYAIDLINVGFSFQF